MGLVSFPQGIVFPLSTNTPGSSIAEVMNQYQYQQLLPSLLLLECACEITPAIDVMG